ncbi:hypothetical protein [Methanococcus aeolicus]|uniref:Uncharacterized protein n=1 Tax=Methanococcus aeolicus (strain ATCC BAA-1280 / DSM 17508 / OCM 812 / Nankai-3) TaxID=419665 RepID=A6UVN2_META3|nr:hypothetical protein [Methanococcus aeolicus]ABR56554.1 hypothetical protein Maeo_0976 [Methanococcus aeolicus Nankai-3]UXM84559.1 hypothetical protein N6C89_07420 [Methanococcus aeolicus]
MLKKCFTILLAILLLASPVNAFFSFDFSMSQSRAVAGATIATEIIADTMVSNYIDENHPEYSGAYTVVSLIFDPTGKIVSKLSSKGLKYANEIYDYSKKADNGKDIVDSNVLNNIFDKDLIEELAEKKSRGYNPKTVADNVVNLLDEGVEPENINKLFKDAVKNDKKLGWIDNRISKLKDKRVETSTINSIIKNSNKPNDALKKAVDETNKLSKMGISKSSIAKITKNANNVNDLTKQRKIIGNLKKRHISDDAINELIEKGYDLEKAKDTIVELRNKGVPAKIIDDLIKKEYSLKEISALQYLKGKIDFKDIEKLSSIKNPDNPSQYVLQKVLRDIAKNNEKANDIAFELKTASRLIDKGENVIKFSMNHNREEIDALTDKAVYECKNIKPSKKISDKDIRDWTNQLNRKIEATGKTGILVFPKHSKISVKNAKEIFKKYNIEKVAFVSDKEIIVKNIDEL